MIGVVDIGGTKIAVGMLDRDGRILARREQPSGTDLALPDGLRLIFSMLRETAREAGGKLEGLGVGCTGPVDALAGILQRIEFLPTWEGCHLTAELQAAFGVTAFLEKRKADFKGQ